MDFKVCVMFSEVCFSHKRIEKRASVFLKPFEENRRA